MAGTHPLKTFRTSQKPPITRAELARRLNVSRATVSRWERGERNVDRELVATVAEETGISPQELRPDLAEIFGGSR